MGILGDMIPHFLKFILAQLMAPSRLLLRYVRVTVLVAVCMTILFLMVMQFGYVRKEPVILLLQRNLLNPEVEERLPPVRQRLPQAFLLGAGKCGTGALRNFLSYHPNVVVPSVEEIWFYYTMYQKGETWHLHQMPLSSPTQVTIECSPAYFHEPRAMSRINLTYPNALFFVILRDPVDRAISHYLHDIRQDQIMRKPPPPKQTQAQLAETFEKTFFDKSGRPHTTANQIMYGEYSKVLKSWLKLIPKSRIHVVDGSQFLKSPFQELKKLEEFLGLPGYYKREMFVRSERKGFYCYRNESRALLCAKQDKGNKHPPIQERYLDAMARHFEPFNEELYELIGRRFSWRKASQSDLTGQGRNP